MTPLDRLASALASDQVAGTASTPPEIPANARQAAVLILLTSDSDPAVTLIERAAGLRKHAGQIAFPGGAVDPEDTSVVQAALRETTEEIGLPANLVDVVGQMRRSWVPVSGFSVTPVVGTWDGRYPIRPAQVAEVAAVHQVPMSELADPKVRVSSRHPEGYVGPAFELGDSFVWGLTAHLLGWVLDLGGWAQPWDASRVVDVPKRFQRDAKSTIWSAGVEGV